MMFLWLAAAAVLPGVYWEHGPETAPALKRAKIEHIHVPAALGSAWKDQAGISVEVADLSSAIKLTTPAMRFVADEASASRAPWVDANGWRFLRAPTALFTYKASGGAAALAAAEAFAYGVRALISTDQAGLDPLARMLEFLGTIDERDLAPVADIGFLDDGSAPAGELMNLLMRRNLLFRVVKTPDPKLAVNVRPEGSNPALFAERVRAELTDDRRSLRVYGSEVVIARVTGGPEHVRLHLINYGGAGRPVRGLRIRVRGRYGEHRAALPGGEVIDYKVGADATEFTVTELGVYGVVDLTGTAR